MVYDIVGYYLASKRNEVLTFTATWMSLEDIMLSGISQTLKEKYRGNPLRGFRDRKWSSCGQELGGVKRNCLRGTEFPYGKMKKFWKEWLHNSVIVLQATELYL